MKPLLRQYRNFGTPLEVLSIPRDTKSLILILVLSWVMDVRSMFFARSGRNWIEEDLLPTMPSLVWVLSASPLSLRVTR